jgi:hypothetical protein
VASSFHHTGMSVGRSGMEGCSVLGKFRKQRFGLGFCW